MSSGETTHIKERSQKRIQITSAATSIAPKPARVTCLKDLPAFSMNTLELFCDISFDVPPATKAINAYRSILQELERALKQITMKKICNNVFA